MKGLKAFFYGALTLFIANFCFGFLDNCTFHSIKQYYNEKYGDSTIVADTINENDINISIAKELQKMYGADSLNITSISKPSTEYEYYVSGVKGIKKLEDENQRVKNVEFVNGNLQYKIMVIYDKTNGSIIKMENDTKPTKVNDVNPAAANVIMPISTNVSQCDTTINDNNKNIGIPTSDYSNNSDV